MRKLGVLMGALAALTFAPGAQADGPNVFGDIGCVAQTDNGNVRLCSGQTETWDGTGIDVNVFLPPASQGDGPFPAIGFFHGWGGSKIGFGGNPADAARIQSWAERGYLVFSMSDRGWGGSCGARDLPDRLNPEVCEEGYNHLMDTRYEVRDAQHFFSLLADEGRILADRIGVTGASYGGGISMALAALKDRVMMPNGELVPWISPDGKAMSIAVAAPEIPWTDLAYSLMPNGGTLDYVADNTYLGPRGDYPIGVMKQSFVSGLYASGQANSNYAPPGHDEDADLVRWFALINAGEPYDDIPLTEDIVDEVTTHHSSYYIPTGSGPAPLLISNGWTDDLFPPDEAIRFYNRTRTQFPGSDISLYFLDWGHQRGKSRPSEVAKLRATQEAWFDHYLKGMGTAPAQGATGIRQTCGDEEYGSVSPVSAPTWNELSPGEIRFFAASSKTIAPAGGDPNVARAFDPVVAGQNPCGSTSAADQPGTATYRLPQVSGGGYTLMGSPTVIADISSPSPTSQIAARLLDVAPNGQQTLVARALYRPGVGAIAPGSSRQVFQLHANGWKFEKDHVAKLELLPQDAPYGRASNGQGPVTVSNLDLRLPTLDAPEGGPGSGGSVQDPAPAIIPAGAAAAPGIEAARGCETGLELKGTSDDDTLTGTAGGDRLRGKLGDDRIAGKDGEDCINGNKGEDRLRGNDGDDRIRTRDGERDRVSCGKGEDTVIIDREDTVRGCETKKR